MHHHEQVHVIGELLGHLDRDTNVDAGCLAYNPVSAYTDPDLAALEWQALFRQRPHIVGLSTDLPGPHSYLTRDDLDVPMLCTRDADGTFRALLNVCRHRGTLLESEARGTKRRFACPFHAWTYASDGQLLSIPKPHHFGPIDRACHHLVELPSVERHGLLLVHPDPTATIDDDLFGDLDDELANWHLHRAQHVTTTTYHHPMNWKLAIDTFGETYHFDTLHRNTLASDYYGNVQTYDTYGPHHRMVLCLRSIDRYRTQPEDQWNILLAGTPVYYLFPNTQLLLTAGGPVLAQIYPDGPDPDHSHTRLSFYANPDIDSIGLDPTAQDHVADLERRMTRFAEVIRDEDYVAAASGHIGARTGAQTHVTFGRNEPALHHYHNQFRRALGQPPLPTSSSETTQDEPVSR